MRYVHVYFILLFSINISTFSSQIPTRVVMVDHMGSATENKMEPTILNGKGGDVFVWEEGVHGTSSKSLLN